MSKESKPEDSPLEELSIGDFLRTERENRGVSKRSLAENIKVREQVIDSIENEEWDRLPARVFIKGFIRSCAISLGLDTKKTLSLFDKCVPAKSEEPPRSLTGKEKKKKTGYYVILALIIMAVAAYLLMIKDDDEIITAPAGPVSEAPVSFAEDDSMHNAVNSVTPANTAVIDKVEEITAGQPAPPKPEPQGSMQVDDSQGSEEKLRVNEEIDDETSSEDPVEETAEVETLPEVENGSGLEDITLLPPDSGMLLKAKVNMRTYLRVAVDDNEPKEYIFQPGSSPSWAAERGFEVKVGNAAGIEFEFNGEKIDNIGGMGKVKTLYFPENFKTNWEEE